MARNFKATGIHITAGIGPCAYHCRYCQLAYRKQAKFGAERYFRVVEKFLDYQERVGKESFGVSQWMGYTYDIEIEEFAKKLELYRRCGWNLKLVLMGGVRHRSDDELKKWFAERKALNIELVGASFYGYGDTHDYWNNRQGDFEYQINAQKIAASVGLDNFQRIFLLKSVLPDLERVLDRVEEVDNVVDRVAYPLFYSGLARKYQNERVTREMLENQPGRVKAIYRDDRDRWKSEKEWIEFVRTDSSDDEEGHLTLLLTDKNIAEIESKSCEEIMEDLTSRTEKAYAASPSRAELCEKYSDRENDNIYMFMWDMECQWMDRYLEKHPLKDFERELTNFGR